MNVSRKLSVRIHMKNSKANTSKTKVFKSLLPKNKIFTRLENVISHACQAVSTTKQIIFCLHNVAAYQRHLVKPPSTAHRFFLYKINLSHSLISLSK